MLGALRSVRGRLTLAALLVLTAFAAVVWRQAEVWAGVRATRRSTEDVLATYATTAAWTLATRLENARPGASGTWATLELPAGRATPLLPPALLGAVPSCAALVVAVYAPTGAGTLAVPRCPGAAEASTRAPLVHVPPQVAVVQAGALAGWRVTVQVTPALAAHVHRAHGRREAIWLATLLAVATGAGALLVLVDLRRHARVTRMREDFVTGISHDLRTPLTHVALLAETLRLGRERTPAEREYMLGAISREAERLRALVDRVVAFAADERGATTLHPEPTDLLAHVQLAIDAARRLAPAETTFEVDEAGAEAWALADRGALAQVLGNLLDNAVRYGPAAQRIRVTVATRGAEAVVTVDDEGPGVPAAERARVFAPFERGAAATHASGGAGLGLALARQLTTRMRGRLWIADAPGGGARLALALPAVPVRDLGVDGPPPLARGTPQPAPVLAEAPR